MFNKKKNDNEVKLSDFSNGLSGVSEETLTSTLKVFKDFIAKLENELEYRKHVQEEKKELEEKYVGKYFRRLEEDKESYSKIHGLHVIERLENGSYKVEYIEETYRKNKYGYTSNFTGSYGEVWTAGEVEDARWNEISKDEFNIMRSDVKDHLYIF